MVANKAKKAKANSGKKNGGVSKARGGAPRAARTMVPRLLGGLDQAAREYAQLIADPCNAKLVGTIWPGSGGSFVTRFESDFIIGTPSANAIFVYVPGANIAYVTDVALATDTTATHLTRATGPYAPGETYLAAQGGFRPVAACMQVSFPGKELDRAGIVSGGVMPFSSLAETVLSAEGGFSALTNCAAVRQACQHTERMPSNMMEITWFPGAGDNRIQGMGTLAATTTSDLENFSTMNALVMSAAGMTVGPGVRIRMVSVFEWTPLEGSGFVSTATPPPSGNTINDVLRAIPASKGLSWFINAYAKSQPYLRGAGQAISYAAKHLGPMMAVI